jgi:hypothetical protein
VTSSSHPLQEGSFDPLALLRRSRGDNDLRDIKLRLLWLRQREPDAEVRTKLVSLDERAIVLSARITLPGGGTGSAHAASPNVDPSTIQDTIADTELRAIGRALDVIGYVITDAPAASQAEPEPPRTQAPPAEVAPAETPRRQPPGHVQAIRALREREQHPPAPEQVDAPELDTVDLAPTPIEPTPSRSPQRGPQPVDRAAGPIETAPVDLSERRRPAPPQAETPPPAPDDDDEPELEDISWTAFWGWTRRTYQIGSRGQVEELLGQPVDKKTPGELRQLLIAHFEANPRDPS